jgi:lipoprotein-releasing system ATP-binding protein
MTLICLEGVDKSYLAANGQPLPVLREAMLNVDRGESVAIVGPSGCGKSTLLNVIGALDTVDRGRVLIDDQPLGQMNEKQLAALRSRRIGFIFQQHHLLPQCSVLENVLVPTLATDAADRKSAPDRAAKLLGRVGLADRIDHRPSQLSGGECQRVAVVRALINQPDIVLADEPTGALDHANAANLIDLLVELNAEQDTALVMVTHASDLAARMQRAYRLIDGRLESDAPDGN